MWESRPILPGLYGSFDGGDISNEKIMEAWNEIDRHIRGFSKVACFTQDWSLPERVLNPDALRGWAHLSLWAHYADGHRGLCLRFDRERLVSAFEKSRGSAIHQFSGPVRYRSAEHGLGPKGINVEHVEEFGTDAAALRYAELNRDRIFFMKHADWSRESEYRLVRTDLSTDCFHFDFADALTGVILGDEFPRAQIPALNKMLENFTNVDVLQAWFHNRIFQVYPAEVSAEFELEHSSEAEVSSVITPRHTVTLGERLRALEASDCH